MDKDNVENRYAEDVDQEVKLATFRTITTIRIRSKGCGGRFDVNLGKGLTRTGSTGVVTR
jgi:hypothetical protein